MNNLNRNTTPQHGNQVPDILRNVNIKEDVNEKSYQKQKIDDIIEKKPLNTDTTAVEDDMSDIHDKEEKRRKSRKIKKGACLVGWIFCCPVFCVWNFLRESPVDDEDVKEDYCYPCYS